MSQTTPQIFDRSLLRARQCRALAGGAETFLLDRVAEDAADRLSAILRHFDYAIDLATSHPAFRRVLTQRRDKIGALIALAETADFFDAAPQGNIVIADAERLPLADASIDLVVSALALQYVNDLPGTFAQVCRALKPDGLFLAALIGGETLQELRQSFAAAEVEIEGGASPRVAPFADVQAIAALLQRTGFALPVTDLDRVIVRYDSAFALMQDLRRMGATNVLIERRRTPLRRDTLMRMAAIYAERFADPDGRLRATFDIIWLSGWAPHDSQQQPLRPGSAKHRLADALGTREFSIEEKAPRE